MTLPVPSRQIAPGRVPIRRHLLPVQLRHGARLIGRWETEDGRVVAVWEYDDRPAYERIESAVRRDPDSRRARQYRATLPPLITGQEETFMTSTLQADHR
jgi:NIPSNAP